jgi:hypothetical protein
MEERRFGIREGWRLPSAIRDLPFLSQQAKRNILSRQRHARLQSQASGREAGALFLTGLRAAMTRP